jgi:crotonobetainyl-CoA:carnitine CoA-transferase CaiB-like acyl-CoA transferase
MTRALEGLTVLEFAQFLAAPSAGLRLADLGATVIKIERPKVGEAGRQIAIKHMFVDGDSLVFHTVNRNKLSYAADLKNPADMERVKQLIGRADVMTHNFRPGVMEKLGLDYESARRLNPHIIYGEVTGYGKAGPWKDKPGQDLLVQSVSGLTWLSGSADHGPVPFGIAVVDVLCGAHLAQGILAALYRRARTGRGAYVECSLLESILDAQFEYLTTYLADEMKPPRRGGRFNANAYLAAPYGIYPTTDGFLALAMGDLKRIAQLIGCAELVTFDASQCFTRRDEIQQAIAARLSTRTTQQWLDVLDAADVWCADVFDYAKLVRHEAYKALRMEQMVRRDNVEIRTTRCPLRIDGDILTSERAAPRVGQADWSTVTRAFQPVPEARVVESLQHGLKARVTNAPLDGLLVVDLSQFLSGPCASLRLADLGARVIKVERPGTGDICRQLYVSNVRLDGDSTVFHAINRNKESFAADLKTAHGLEQVKRLIRLADVVMHNFRPGVIERLGLDYNSLREINPRIVYGQISGYGSVGPWKDKPGQDLLVQSLSGLTWLSGDASDGPVPMGIAIADILCGMHLAQGILACLVRRSSTGKSGLVEVSMLESTLDLQFETFTTFLQDGGQPVRRTATNNAHAYLGAPYGIYRTSDGYLALAMGRIPQLGELLGCKSLLEFEEPAEWFTQRDRIKSILADHLKNNTTAHWLSILEPADIWCAHVLDWQRLLQHDACKALGMFQTVRRGTGTTYQTTRCPIRIDGRRLYSERGSPDLGEHTQRITRELLA